LLQLESNIGTTSRSNEERESSATNWPPKQRKYSNLDSIIYIYRN
jgi:hypothetical protein